MICLDCQRDLTEDKFSFRNKLKKKRQSRCKECHKKYSKKHYENNKKDYLSRAKRDRKKEKLKTKNLLELLKIKCQICGEDHPAVLDFHHKDPNDKDANISKMNSRSKIIEESKKCIVLCSNCHRKLHWEERGDVR